MVQGGAVFLSFGSPPPSPTLGTRLQDSSERGGRLALGEGRGVTNRGHVRSSRVLPVELGAGGRSALRARGGDLSWIDDRCGERRGDGEMSEVGD